MIAHLPILQVVIPLLAAPLCMVVRIPRLAWTIALLASSGAFVISLLLLQTVLETGTVSYLLGGWPSPWGIEYRIDQLNAYVLLLVTSLGTIVLFSAPTSLGQELPADRHPLFCTAYLLCLAGLLGVTATGDVFNLFVFLELSSLSSYTLIALGSDRRALTAAYRYLIMGTIGATFILIGIGLMYMTTGSLNMYDLAQRLPEMSQPRTLLTAFAFFVTGVCLKLALFPLHQWLPNAYAHAPSVVTAFLAATATKVAIYVLVRFVYSIFGTEFSFSTMPLQTIFLIAALLGIFICSVSAIYQSNVKHIFAYSSVAQIGYMILAFSFGTATGLIAMLLHLFNHALMKGALFLAVGAVIYRVGSSQLQDFSGMGRHMPWTMAAIVAAGLSLIGVPLSVGFVSKWYLVVAALEQDMWPIAVLVLLGSLLAIAYVWRLVEVAYYQQADNAHVDVQEAPISLLIPIWTLVAANVYFGIDTRLTVGVSEMATRALFGAGP